MDIPYPAYEPYDDGDGVIIPDQKKYKCLAFIPDTPISSLDVQISIGTNYSWSSHVVCPPNPAVPGAGTSSTILSNDVSYAVSGATAFALLYTVAKTNTDDMWAPPVATNDTTSESITCSNSCYIDGGGNGRTDSNQNVSDYGHRIGKFIPLGTPDGFSPYPNRDIFIHSIKTVTTTEGDSPSVVDTGWVFVLGTAYDVWPMSSTQITSSDTTTGGSTVHTGSTVYEVVTVRFLMLGKLWEAEMPVGTLGTFTATNSYANGGGFTGCAGGYVDESTVTTTSVVLAPNINPVPVFKDGAWDVLQGWAPTSAIQVDP